MSSTPEQPQYSHELYKLYDYLRTETPCEQTPATGIVFGRDDPLIGERAAQLALAGEVESLVFTGGVGKDSGPLLATGYRSEADFLSVVFHNRATPRYIKIPVFLDHSAIDGTENAINSLRIIHQKGSATTELLAIAHATSLRRLAETLRKESTAYSHNKELTVGRRASNYVFEPNNPNDEKEALLEGLRLLDWPQQGNLLPPQEEIDGSLEDFIRERSCSLGLKTPQVASRLQRLVLHSIPKRIRPTIMQRLV